MVDTFDPPRTPTTESGKETKIRILKSDFGDGYSQRAGDGLNATAASATLVWDVLTASEAAEIDDFFRDQGGYTAFYYTLPGESTQKSFTCESWSQSYTELHYKISAKISQVFDIL